MRNTPLPPSIRRRKPCPISRQQNRSAFHIASSVSSRTNADGVFFVGDSLSLAGTMKPVQMTPAGRQALAAVQVSFASAAQQQHQRRHH